jgi:hypothetical protein
LSRIILTSRRLKDLPPQVGLSETGYKNSGRQANYLPKAKFNPRQMSLGSFEMGGLKAKYMKLTRM